MATIQYPRDRALGALVNAFPKVQYEKIKEIIDALNAYNTSLTTTDLTVTDDLAVGDAATVTGILTANGTLDVNGTRIILDADADTSITADTDDQIDIEVSGADDFRITANTFTALSGSSIATNTIAETTAGNGVIIDGALIKDAAFDTNVAAAGVTLAGTTLAADGTDADIDITITPKGTGDVVISTSIAVPDGSVGDLSLKIGADENNGIYGVSDTQLGFAVEGVLVGGANTLGLFTDIISEQTATTGVTVDQALIKDGSFSTSGAYARLKPIGAKQALVGAGAATITEWYTTLDTNAGAAAITLANASTIGQSKKIQMIVDGGDATLTPTSLSGGTTITFADAGDYVVLVWNGTAWVMEEAGNAADGVTAPVLA